MQTTSVTPTTRYYFLAVVLGLAATLGPEAASILRAGGWL